MSIIKSIKQVLGLSGTASENHFWDGSVPNQLALKRGTPEAPGSTVLKTAGGQVTVFDPAQSWQDVTVQRVWGTDYVNNTGMPIQVAVGFDSTPGVNLVAYSVVNGVHVSNIFIPSALTTSTVAQCLGFTVPVGATYTVVLSGASSGFWNELR